MAYGEPELKAQLEAAFGKELNANQLWALTNLAKRVRLRARNNAAFNSLMNRLFPHANFRQVSKTRKDGTPYQGLSIVVNGKEHSQDEDEES